MKIPLVIILLYMFGCRQADDNSSLPTLHNSPTHTVTKSYEEIKHGIVLKRKDYFARYPSFEALAKNGALDSITDFWVGTISDDLYESWQNTPWDFNGTTRVPQRGAIACGYFVTTILKDMSLPIQVQKLAVCPSSEMMKSLFPLQKIKNLSYLDYAEFNDNLKRLSKGVYIIGLDFHTGFIVNDGKENWFIHSNYIMRKGVTKEAVLISAALRSSKTRWLISLTGDKDFLYRWLKQK
ncbi:MAG: hypothetical protein ABIN67_06350 [Ferruginibacter sp.]